MPRLTGRFGVVVLTLSLVAGCAVHHLSPQDPGTFLPDKASTVILGQMERPAVRGLLGAPQLSSVYWGFDLFCAQTEQTEVVFAVTPWPIPIGRFKDQLQRYTLVAYDTEGRSSAVETGIFRRPAAWRSVHPIETDFPSLHLRAADLMFFVDPEGAREVNLLAAPTRRDVFLRRVRASTGCTVILGCGERGCGDRLAVDAGQAHRLPTRIAHTYWFREDERDAWLQGVEAHGRDTRMPWLEALVAIALPEGEHALAFSAEHLGGNASVSFVCRPGEVTYLVVNASDNGSFVGRALVDWQIDRSDAMPERFARRPLVLLDDGQWYVDAEPSE